MLFSPPCESAFCCLYLWQTDTFREALSEKLTDKQKSRLWEQQRTVNFQASCRLEEGNGPSASLIGTLPLGPHAPGLPHLCAIHYHLYHGLVENAGKYRRVDISKGDILFCHFDYIEKAGNELMEKLENEGYLVGCGKEAFIAGSATTIVKLTCCILL